MTNFPLKRSIYFPGASKPLDIYHKRDQQLLQNLNPGLYLTWSWICIFYAALVISISLAFIGTYGLVLIDKELVLNRYLTFYLYLYVVAIICMLIKYLISNYAKNTIIKAQVLMLNMTKKCWKKSTTVAEKNEIQMKERKWHLNDEENDEPLIAVEEKPFGRLGLQVGLKVTTVIVLVTIFLDISEFVHLKMLDELCQPNLKGAVIGAQLVFVIGLSYYCMNNHKVKMHRYPLFAHFCLAHLFATTVCMGLSFLSYDTIAKLEHWLIGKQKGGDDDAGTRSTSINHTRIQDKWNRFYATKKESQNDNSFCHLDTYFRDITRSIGPYTFTFCMFYVFICSIVLFHLILHYRGMSIQSNLLNDSGFWALFHRKKKITLQNSVSGVASFSLIVIALVVSILSLDNEDNIFIHIYLLLMHSQANVVCILVLKRISHLKIDVNKRVAADYLVLLWSFFGVALCNVTKHVTAVFSEDGISALEIVTSFVEIVQTLEQTVLIFVGLKIVVTESTLHKPPSELLLHLAAGNISALITSTFLTRMELFSVSVFFESSKSMFNVGLTWSLVGSILLPWQAFYRYYSIVCLAEVKKIVEA